MLYFQSREVELDYLTGWFCVFSYHNVYGYILRSNIKLVIQVVTSRVSSGPKCYPPSLRSVPSLFFGRPKAWDNTLITLIMFPQTRVSVWQMETLAASSARMPWNKQQICRVVAAHKHCLSLDSQMYLLLLKWTNRSLVVIDFLRGQYFY